MRFSNLFKRGYLSKIIAVFSGSLLGQSIPFFLTPVLSKIYTPEQFSELGIFVTVFSVITMFATLKFEFAFLIPDTDVEVYELLKISLLSLLFVSVSTSFFLIFLDIPFYFKLIGLATFLFGISQIGVQFTNRYNRNKLLVAHKSLVGPSSVFSQLLLSSHASGLILGKLIGDTTSILPLIKSLVEVPKVHLTLKRIKHLLFKYKDFPSFLAVHGIVSLLSNKAPVLVFAHLNLSVASGEFEMVSRIGIAPITLICSSLYLAFSEKFSQIQKGNGNAKLFLVKNIRLSLLIFILPLLLVCISAPYLIPKILGNEWKHTGLYFLYMFPAFSTIILTSPYVYIPQYFMKQKQGLIGSILISVFQIICLFIGLQMSSDIGLIMFSIASAIGNLSYLYFIFYLIKINDKNITTANKINPS